MPKIFKILCLLFIVVVAALTFLVLWKRDREKSRTWLFCNVHKLTALFLALFSTVYMFKHAAAQSLWVDELWQISFELTTLDQALKWFYTSNHALFHFFSFLWYRIAPYGEQWLVLPSVIATGAGVYMTALCGFRLKNGYTGMIAALLTGFSQVVMEQCGMEFRMYGFVFFFSALLLYLFLGHIKAGEEETAGSVWGRFIVMLALSLNHLYGFVFSCGFLIIDFVLLFLKRIKRSGLLVYPLLIFVYTPILLATYTASNTGWDKHEWMIVPGWSAVYKLLRYLAGNTQWGYVLLVVSTVGLCSLLVRRYREQSQRLESSLFELTPLFVMLIMIGFGFCFGNLADILHFNGTLWVERYFSGLIPCAALLSALGINGFSGWVQQRLSRRLRAELFIILLLCAVPNRLLAVYDSVTTLYEPYREAAEWLYEQEDIFEADTVVITAGIEDVAVGWTEYYLTRQGQRPSFKLLCQNEIEEDTGLLLKYDKVYLQYSHFDVEDKLQLLLDNNYKLEQENPDLDIAVYVREPAAGAGKPHINLVRLPA